MQRALLDGQLTTLVYQRTGPMPINLYKASAWTPANINIRRSPRSNYASGPKSRSTSC